MSQYIIKFSKEGYICYTSHLDMLRLFKRTLKKAGIALSYSQGFNPHPKMGFAQPLSLGYLSMGEYLEFETTEDYEPDMLGSLLAERMPEGIRILSCEMAENQKKSLAARTAAAEYMIGIPLTEIPKEDGSSLCSRFLAQEEIKVLKKQKKTKTLKEVDIKDKIRNLNFTIAGENLLVTALLDSGSDSNLSPELLILAIREFYPAAAEREEIGVMRTKIIFNK